MSGWQEYINFLRQDNICESAHIISKENGSVFATSHPQICQNNQLPMYQKPMPDETNPDKTVNVVIKEIEILFDAINNKGVSKNKAGVHICGEKYYTVNFDAERKTWYLKKNASEVNKRVEQLGAMLANAGW